MAPLKLHLQSFVDCIGLEIYKTVYEQVSRLNAAGLLVTIPKKTDSTSLLENPTRNPDSKL